MKKRTLFVLFAIMLVMTMHVSGFAQQETAWAGDHEFPGKNWARYMMFHVWCNPYCYMADHHTMWAGQNTAVGEVLVGHQAGDNDVWVRYETTEDWTIVETHATFCAEFEDFPMTQKGNPIPGQFMFSEVHPPCTHVVNYQMEIPPGYCNVEIFVAAHAVVEPCENHFASDGKEVTYEVLPTEFELGEPYPNPFNASTTVNVTLPEASNLTLSVFNVAGQQVATLSDGLQSAGSHVFHFDASYLASGVYFVQATVPGELNTMKKVVLMR